MLVGTLERVQDHSICQRHGRLKANYRNAKQQSMNPKEPHPTYYPSSSPSEARALIDLLVKLRSKSRRKKK